MNIEDLSPVALEGALEKKLLELLESISWLKDVSVERNLAESGRIFDLLAEFKVPKGPAVELRVECRRDLRPAQFPSVIRNREFESKNPVKEQSWVFAAPYITPRMAEVCQEHGWGWFDLAGNCRISIPEVLHLERTGNAPVYKRPEPGVNLSTPESARLLRALLNLDHVGKRWTQRSLQEACFPKVSLGLVNKVISHLRDQALIEEGKGRGFVVPEPQNLFALWRDTYRIRNHRRYGYFSLLQGNKLNLALAELEKKAQGRVALAAFSAADIQAPHVRQPKTWLFVDETQLQLFESLVEAKQVDSGDNLIVIVPKDEGVFYSLDCERDESRHLPCTNLMQTVVDLWHLGGGGRGREAADALLEQRIVPVWRRKGIEL